MHRRYIIKLISVILSAYKHLGASSVLGNNISDGANALGVLIKTLRSLKKLVCEEVARMLGNKG
jgi:hypothetical protein